MWSRILSITFVLGIVALVAWAFWPKPIFVETAQVQARDLLVTVEEDGTSRIREIFRVSAPVTGKIARVALHVGDTVEMGQTLASIQPVGPGLLDERSRRVAEAAVQAAFAGVAVAEAGLAQAEANNNFMQAEHRRATALAERGIVSSETEERAALSAATALRGLEAARATLLMNERELDRAKAALIEGEKSTSGSCCVSVRSPASGQILAVFSESEQVIQPGEPLMEVGNAEDLQIQVDVLSSDAVRINPGAQAVIDNWGGKSLRAEVSRVDPIATTKVSALGIEEQRTGVVLRLLDSPQERQGLAHGYRVTAQIEVWRGKDLPTIPISAIFRWREAWAVFVIDGDAARQRIVELGQRNTEYVEVVQGLALDETVIVRPGDMVADGSLVLPLEQSL